MRPEIKVKMIGSSELMIAISGETNPWESDAKPYGEEWIEGTDYTSSVAGDTSHNLWED